MYINKSKYPKVNIDNVSIIKDYTEKEIYWVSSNKRYFKINKDGLELIKLFDGYKSIYEIIDILNARGMLNEIEPIIKYIEKLIDFKIIGLNSNETKQSFDFISLFTKMPHRQIEITRDCNLNCIFCFNNCSPGKGMYMSEPIDLLKKLLRENVTNIEITGGEPLLHKNINEILEFSLQNFESVALLTNGVLLNKEILDIVEAYKNFTIQISLPTINKERYIDLTGMNKLNKVLENILDVKRRNIKLRITTVLLSKKSVEDIKKIADFLISKGITDSYRFSPVIPLGRAKEERVLNILREEFYSLIKFSDNHPAFRKMSFSTDDFCFNNCGAGWKSCLVQPDLKLRPCGMFPIEYSSNILENSDFRKKMYNLQAPSEKFCGECKNIYFCKNCIYRGWVRAQEIGINKCKWATLNNVEGIMNSLLKN